MVIALMVFLLNGGAAAAVPGIAHASSHCPARPQELLACCPSHAPASLDARRSAASADQRSPQLSRRRANR